MKTESEWSSIIKVYDVAESRKRFGMLFHKLFEAVFGIFTGVVVLSSVSVNTLEDDMINALESFAILVPLVRILVPESVAETETIFGANCGGQTILGKEQPPDTVICRNRTFRIEDAKMSFLGCPAWMSKPPKIRIKTVKIPEVNLQTADVEIVIVVDS